METYQWCDCQMKCKEDTEKTWTCCAHLAEGRAFQCRMDPTEVKTTKDGKYVLEKCIDYEPPGYDRNGVRSKGHSFTLHRSEDGKAILIFNK